MLRHRDIRTTMAVYVRDDMTAQAEAVRSLPSLGGGDEVQHIVQHAAHPTVQETARGRKDAEADGSCKSGNAKAYGKNMQEAAAGCDSLGLVAGAGFEPAIFRL